MRILIAGFMLAHGVAHIVGFLGAWAPTRTTIVGNRIDLGAGWIKLIGLLWLAGALGFGVAAIATVLNAAWWPALAIGLAAASLSVCLLQLPDTKFGVALNLVLIAALVGQRAGWF
jgi:predicted anti-sigma-YlaC factor YlaD